jgi:UDP-glucose 4-epimerase
MVTGGAGFIGSHLVDRLFLEKPRSIVVVDNLYLGRASNLRGARSRYGGKLKCYWKDAGNLAVMQKIIQREKVTVIFDLAVVPLPASLRDPLFCVAENTRLTAVLCDLLRRGFYGTLVHFSSSEVYGTACTVPMHENHPLQKSTPYAASKIAGDMVALSYQHTFGLDIAVLRPFNNFGPRQNDGNFAGIIPEVIRRVRLGQPVYVNGDGRQTRDFVFVGDTVEAAVLAYQVAGARGKVINVGSGRETSMNQLIQTLLKILGQPGHPIEYRASRPGDVRRHCGGARLAKSILGFRPRTSLEKGLRPTVAWYLRQELRDSRGRR